MTAVSTESIFDVSNYRRAVVARGTIAQRLTVSKSVRADAARIDDPTTIYREASPIIRNWCCLQTCPRPSHCTRQNCRYKPLGSGTRSSYDPTLRGSAASPSDGCPSKRSLPRFMGERPMDGLVLVLFAFAAFAGGFVSGFS